MSSTRAVSGVAVPPLDPTFEPPILEPARAAGARGREPARAARAVAPLQAVGARGASAPSLAGLAACVEEARAAALVPADGPADPVSFASLRARLEKAIAKLPAGHRSAVGEPLLRALDRLGPAGFARMLASDPDREGEARLVLDLAQAVLQHGDGRGARAIAAFQEVVSDLYDGFVSSSARRGVDAPENGRAAPMVKWGSSADGPYTWPATATATLGVGAAVVSLPAANASAGLLAWPALAHEAAGHDVVAAHDGLSEELSRAVRERLLAAGMPPAVADYWSTRTDEVAADALGVLNMGPASAVGLVGYFRAVNGAWRGTPALRTAGDPEDPHPTDLARAYLAAETVRLLSFEGAGRWADALVAEADRDLGRGVIRLGDVAVTPGVAKESAAIVAQAIVRTRLAALEGRAFQQLQDWRDSDEAVVAELRRGLADGTAAKDPGSAGRRYGEGAYAAHAVAAGVYEAASGAMAPAEAMRGTIAVLAAMHDRNPASAPARPVPGPRDAVEAQGVA